MESWKSRLLVRFAMALASALLSACLDQAVQVPPAPVVARSPGVCAGKHDVFLEPGDLTASRADHTATLLADGRVFLAGGYSMVENERAQLLSSSAIYNPATAASQPAADMGTQRKLATAVRLGDGKVLITGGYHQLGGFGLGATPAPALNTAEIFDPSTNSFHPTGQMMRGRASHSAILLDNGKVMLAGGRGFTMQTLVGSLATGNPQFVEFYDPAGGTFAAADASGTNHAEENAIRLRDGSVLMFCGRGVVAEIYEPETSRFTGTGDMPTAMTTCTASLLGDGRVFILGSTAFSTQVPQVARWRAQLYDPKVGKFSLASDQAVEISEPQSTPLKGGRVLILGSVNPDYANVLSSEVYDAGSNAFSVLGGQHPNLMGFSVTPLSDGSILIAGGSSFSLPYNVRRAVLFCP